jgi:hypothetical protein
LGGGRIYNQVWGGEQGRCFGCEHVAGRCFGWFARLFWGGEGGVCKRVRGCGAWVTSPPQPPLTLPSPCNAPPKAYDFLIAVAEPVCRPESVHEYVLTPHRLGGVGGVLFVC